MIPKFDADTLKEEACEVHYWPDKKVMDAYQKVWKSVIGKDCYHPMGMCRLTIYSLELKRRGYVIQVTQQPLVFHTSEVSGEHTKG